MGRLATRADQNGTVVTNAWDVSNRLTARGISLGAGVQGTTQESYAYDGLNRLLSAVDNDYQVEFTYGVIGLSSQVYEEKQSYVGQTAYLRTVKKTYDAMGTRSPSCIRRTWILTTPTTTSTGWPQ